MELAISSLAVTDLLSAKSLSIFVEDFVVIFIRFLMPSHVFFNIAVVFLKVFSIILFLLALISSDVVSMGFKRFVIVVL